MKLPILSYEPPSEIMLLARHIFLNQLKWRTKRAFLLSPVMPKIKHTSDQAQL